MVQATGRKRQVENPIMISFIMSAENINRVDAITADGVSRSEMLRRFVMAGLERAEQEHEQQRMLDFGSRAEQVLAKARERK